MLLTRPTLADFDHPFEMLSACHDRIKAQCDTLRRLAGHLPLHGCDAQAQQAASNVMRYFDSAGRHHREDEETDLFPCMIAAAQGQNAERVALLIARLQSEHQEIEQLWLALRDVLECIAHQEEADLDPAEVDRFCAAYDAHMALEETSLLPLAERMLKPETVAALGTAMARRRRVKP